METRYCIEYINPQHPLRDDGSLNVKYERVLSLNEAENALTLILSFGGKIYDLYMGDVVNGETGEWTPKPMIVDDDDWFSAEWLKNLKCWIPINKYPLDKFIEVLAYNKEWIDEDKCPNGIRIGFLGEDGFISAIWNMEHDCYDTVYEQGDDYYTGNAYVIEEEKKTALPNMPTHYMLIPDCLDKK